MVMSVGTIFSYILVGLGMFGLLLAFVVPIISFIWWLKIKKIKKKIPEDLKTKIDSERGFKNENIEQAKEKYRGEERTNIARDREYARTGTESRGREIEIADRVIRQPIKDISGTTSIQERGSIPILPNSSIIRSEPKVRQAKRNSGKNWPSFK